MQTYDIENGKYLATNYADALSGGVSGLPYSLRILAENVYRQDNAESSMGHVADRAGGAVAFRPARLIVQDMLGLPLLVDIMAMRSAVAKAGGDPGKIDVTLPIDLIVDHSMTITHWANELALPRNMAREFEVNEERFAFLKACEANFTSLRVIPPGGGIMHQVNLEFLGQVVAPIEKDSRLLIPDTNLGTDSHTPMINGLGILGWGIGGLEGEAIMFGEATTINVPRVVGLEVTGTADAGLTATDIALTVAEKLREHGVVDCFVELFGKSYGKLSVADRGTVANMAPEYGATCVFCPCDERTIEYLQTTGRKDAHIQRIEAYNRAQGLWVTPDDAIEFDSVIPLALGNIRRSVAGPSRPEQRIDLNAAAAALAHAGEREHPRRVAIDGVAHDLGDGDVLIAAITSCTNTANPHNIVLAGLLARNAVAKGLRSKPHVKTSLAPGSRVVAQYLQDSGLQGPLDELGFHIAAFSCSTCNGMSGPLGQEHEDAIKEHGIQGVAVLSGNRNFAGRIHPLASRNVLASPPLVVAYAIAGSILIDLTTEPLGWDENGDPVMLADIWPSAEEAQTITDTYIKPENFLHNYNAISTVNERWNDLEIDTGTYAWAPSTYVTFPPFVENISEHPPNVGTMKGLRPLVILGDSITTDHISPSGMITPDTAAGQFLMSNGVEPRDFNSFGTRRGSSDIVIRSTFSNNRLRNEMTPDREGSWTRTQPDGQVVSIFAAIQTYLARDQELVVIGGKEYGCGSSRDTAAKAPWLAGIRAVIVESFERIHRSNLVNMGIAPLCFPNGVNRHTLALVGSELYDIVLSDDLTTAALTIKRDDGESDVVTLALQLYNDAERETFRHGGLLPRSFRSFMQGAA